MAPDASGALGLGARMRRLRAFWREPHFLAKTRVIAIVLWVGALLVFQPRTALDMLAVFTLFAVIAVLPVMPRVVVPIGLMIALIVGFVPGDAVELATVITLYALFLTAGFACDGRLCALMVALYAMAEITCAVVWGSSSAALEVINGLVDAWSNMFADNMIVGGGADIPDLMAWAFAVAMSMLLSGFAAVFGHSFRISAVAGERLARSEAMVDRMAREQRLAHMIHDSVANDMSVIAMLTWRAKAGLDGDSGSSESSGASGAASVDLAASLDAIYDRSHHALDRVHEVIDVLDGKRTLAELEDDDDADDAEAGEGSGSGANAGSDAGAGADLIVQLERCVEDQDRIMAMIGMRGVSRVVAEGVDPCNPPKRVRRAVIGLVEEIYANIVRHAAWANGSEDAGDAEAYSLFVTVGPKRIRIAEVNAIGGGESAAIRGTKHGNGLAQQRETVESLGGTLNASAQDGTWTIAAEIPVA